MSALYERLAIVGLGLIGGSIGLAARQRRLAKEIVGYSRSARSRETALAIGAVELAGDDLLAIVKDADLIYIATPVGTIPAILEQIAPAVQIGATVTDAGSVKAEICREGAHFLPASFIGGHPMAGSEKSGVQAARADLFVGRTYILTPPEEVDEELFARLREFVRRLGATPIVTTPEEHDQRVALTSHLPHLWVAALTLALSRAPEEPGELAAFVGSGLRDSTRIAEASPELWRDIFFSNQKHLLAACRRAEEALAALRSALERDDLATVEALLEEAKAFREELMAAAGQPEQPPCGLRIAIDGPAGAGKTTVARAVARELGYNVIDTGAMYRAVAYFAMRQGLLPGRHDEEIGRLAGELHFEFRSVGEGAHLFVNGEDVEAAVRLPEVGRLSSPISAIPQVRQNLVVAQRQMAQGGRIVMEGRDIGTVVLPDAELKIFLTASPEERARRRYRQLREMGVEVSYEEIFREQTIRDQRDSSRPIAPLRRAEDAIEINTDSLTEAEVVAKIIQLVRERERA